MPRFARLAAIVLPLAICAAAPRPAAAEQPCSGTFCDFYYGGAGSNDTPASQGKPRDTAPTPVTVPTTGFLGRLIGGGSDNSQTPAAPGTPAPPAKKPLVAVQGGGLLGMMRGDAPERCSGTFCDLYYGAPPPRKNLQANPLPPTAPWRRSRPPTRTPRRPRESPPPSTKTAARNHSTAPRRARTRGAAIGSEGPPFRGAQANQEPVCVQTKEFRRAPPALSPCGGLFVASYRRRVHPSGNIATSPPEAIDASARNAAQSTELGLNGRISVEEL